jgi:hypothetical protein
VGENPLLGDQDACLLGGIFPVKENREELGLEVCEVRGIGAFLFWLENLIVMPAAKQLH